MDGVQYRALYDTGDFAGLEAAAKADPTDTGRSTQLAAMIELGRLAEAGALLETNRATTALVCWTLAGAYRKQGDDTAANHWKARALEKMRAGTADSAAAAGRLANDTPLTVAEAKELVLEPQLKAVVLAALAVQSPRTQTELAELSRLLNVEREFPHHLVQRLTAPTQ